jgi:hypothetical protein
MVNSIEKVQAAIDDCLEQVSHSGNPMAELYAYLITAEQTHALTRAELTTVESTVFRILRERKVKQVS